MLAGSLLDPPSRRLLVVEAFMTEDRCTLSLLHRITCPLYLWPVV